jgi:hypothetical protein
LQEIKIFGGRFSTSVMRQLFHQLFRFAGRLGNSIARRPNLQPECQISAGTMDLQAAKQIPFLRWKFISERLVFSAVGAKESLEISNCGRILSAAGRWSKDNLKIALFRRLPEVVGSISALSLEIRIVSRKFKSSAGNPSKSRNFSTRAGSFRSSAELLNFQPEIRKFS